MTDFHGVLLIYLFGAEIAEIADIAEIAGIAEIAEIAEIAANNHRCQ